MFKNIRVLLFFSYTKSRVLQAHTHPLFMVFNSWWVDILCWTHTIKNAYYLHVCLSFFWTTKMSRDDIKHGNVLHFDMKPTFFSRTSGTKQGLNLLQFDFFGKLFIY